MIQYIAEKFVYTYNSLRNFSFLVIQNVGVFDLILFIHSLILSLRYKIDTPRGV